MIGVSSWSPYGRQLAPPDIPVVVYGTRWCAATQIVRRHLERVLVEPTIGELNWALSRSRAR